MMRSTNSNTALGERRGYTFLGPDHDVVNLTYSTVDSTASMARCSSATIASSTFSILVILAVALSVVFNPCSSKTWHAFKASESVGCSRNRGSDAEERVHREACGSSRRPILDCSSRGSTHLGQMLRHPVRVLAGEARVGMCTSMLELGLLLLLLPVQVQGGRNVVVDDKGTMVSLPAGLVVAGNAPIQDWDTSNVKNMYELFLEKRNFNSDISKWQTGQVTDMHNMFKQASSFNSDLSKWQTERVIRMSWIFSQATSFNSDLSKWQTENMVPSMDGLFNQASSFNSDLSKWQTEKVRWMRQMFFAASSFNSDLSKWQTETVTSMHHMFSLASSFNADLSMWRTEKVTSMWSMFKGASSFNADISQWDVSRLRVGPASQGLTQILTGATVFVQDLRPWKNRSPANGGLSASTSTSDMGYVVLSTAARGTLEANSSLLALGNETHATPAACTGSPTGVPCHTLYAGTSYAVEGLVGAFAHGLDFSTLLVTLRGEKKYSPDSFHVDLQPKQPGLVFVEQQTGAWTLNPTHNLINKTFTAALVAHSSASGAPGAIVKKWAFTVQQRPPFSTTDAWKKARGPWSLAAAHNYRTSYTAGLTLTLAKPNLPRTRLFQRYSGDVAGITYSLQFTNRTDRARNTSVDLPFYINAQGETLAQPTDSGEYDAVLLAQDAAGATTRVYEWTFIVHPARAFSVKTHKDAPRIAEGAGFTDYDGFGGPYYLGSDYKIAPKLIDRKQTVFSDSQTRTITYRLNQTNATEFFVNSNTGVIYGKFDAKLDPGTYAISLVAAEESGQIDTVETYTFRVQAPPTFRVKTHTDAPRIAEGAGFTDYDGFGGPYYLGSDYKIALKPIDRKQTVFSDDQTRTITYRLNQTNATEFFVNSNTGVIYGKFDATLDPGTYAISLVAAEESGQTDTVETYTFRVQAPPTFRVKMLTDAPRIFTGQGFDDYGNGGGPYYLGSDYKIAPKPIDRKQTVFSDSQTRTITFRLNQTNATAFFVNSNTGVIYGKFDAKLNPGSYTVGLIAAEESGQTDTVETYTFRVQAPPAFLPSKMWTDFVADSEHQEHLRSSSYLGNYTVGDTYTLKRPPFSNGMMFRHYSSNDAAAIRYSMKVTYAANDTTAALKFYVDSSGETLAQPRPSDVGSYTGQLVATDGGGSETIVYRWTFNIVKKETFSVTRWQYAPAPVNSSNVYVPVNSSNVHMTSSANNGVDAVDSYDFAVGTTYRFPGIDATSLATVPDKAKTSASYTLEGAPDGFLTNTQTGYIQGTSSAKGNYNTTLYIVDTSTGSRFALRMFEVRLKLNDTATEENGPNNATCVNGAALVDHVEFDNDFACNCTQDYVGENCETSLVHNTNNSSDGNSSTATVLSVLFGAIALAAATYLAITKHKAYKKANAPVDFVALLQQLRDQGMVTDEQVAAAPATSSGVNVPRELGRSWLTMIHQLGAGNFGEVWKATLVDGSSPHAAECLVAAKIVLTTAAGSDEFGADNAGALAAEKDLIQEALLMAQVDEHPHLVAIIGVITRGSPKVLVLSFCELGELQGLLRKRAADGGVFGAAIKHRFCSDIAAGMAHLALHNFVHRDLAARNVLLAFGLVCKVADFGLSRRVQTEDNSGDYYRSSNGGLLPVRWTAPEGLSDQKFSTASDVWSFGITCVEVFQDGAVPYSETRSNPAIMQMVVEGHVHAQPPSCSSATYEVLRRCFAFEPAERPAFNELATFFKKQKDVQPSHDDGSHKDSVAGSTQGVHDIAGTNSIPAYGTQVKIVAKGANLTEAEAHERDFKHLRQQEIPKSYAIPLAPLAISGMQEAPACPDILLHAFVLCQQAPQSMP